MKKVHNITIGTVIFAIEDDAYEKLKSYLSDIKDHFKSSDDGQEISNDIENSIAEKFVDQGKSDKKAITLNDVNAVIKDMGDASSFDDEQVSDTSDTSERTTDKSQRRFYRDPDDKVLGGVASGLGAYFDMDVFAIRVLFILLFIFTGFFPFVILYVLLWALMPEAKTASQKLEMRGEKVTVSSIKDSVKETVENVKKKDLSGVKKVIASITDVFRAIGKAVIWFFRVVIPTLLFIIGLVLIIAGSVTVAAVLITALALFFGGTVWILDPLVVRLADTIFFQSWHGFVALLGVIGVVIIPLLFLMISGISMLRRKNAFNVPTSVVLLILWFASIGVVAGTAIKHSDYIEQEVERYDETEHNWQWCVFGCDTVEEEKELDSEENMVESEE